MSKVTVTESYLEGIGDAIREKLNTSQGYMPAQMAAAIESIPTGGVTPTGTINITQNGTADVTQYASAAVNVPNSYAAGDEGKVVQSGALVAQTSETVTQNGTYDTTTKDEVVVSVRPNLQSKTVTQNGTVTPDSGYDGLSSVVVNVSGGGGLTPVVVTPTVHEASFIGTSGTLAMNNSIYQDYRCISVELSQFAGKLIRIVNTGNRNYWGLYSAIADGQSLRIVDSRQQTNGELIFYADDYAGLPNVHYIVYDFTSSAQSAPIVEIYDIEP